MKIHRHILAVLRPVIVLFMVFPFSLSLSFPQLHAADLQPPPAGGEIAPGNLPPSKELSPKTVGPAHSGKEVGIPTGTPPPRSRPLPRAPGIGGRATSESSPDHKAAERYDEHILRGKQLPKAGITEIRRTPEEVE